LSATLSETEAALVEVGAEIAISSRGEESPGGDAVRGKVTAVLGSLDPQTRRVPLIAEIPNDGKGGLRAGAFVRGTILAKDDVPALKLPANALRPGSQDEIVIDRGGRAHLAHVVFSLGPDGALFVRNGLAPNEGVVVGPSAEM